MTRLAAVECEDREVRLEALDVTRSFLVQAPAGSGKTELLTQRFLKLLAVVEAPEQVLAITFTRAATAEMRRRILTKLESARGGDPKAAEEAGDALRNSDARGWNLLERPQQLNIQTIDSLSLQITREMPLLARLGGRLAPVEDATTLYALAAQRTLDRLGGPDAELNLAVTSLLELRDNNLADCERLIAEMLSRRDQWAHAFMLAGEVDWSEVRERLELPFLREIRRVLGEAHSLFSSRSDLVEETMLLANYACEAPDLRIDIRLLAGGRDLPEPAEDFAGQWRCLCNLLLTKEGEWRKKPNKNHGFPPQEKSKQAAASPGKKQRMEELIEALGKIDGLLSSLCEIRRLPPPRYNDEQWAILKHLFTTLRFASAELGRVFAERGSVDFVELGIAARDVLKLEDTEQESDATLFARDRNIRHLLVDEFQDTSRKQHELISALVRNWQRNDGRTCFLVGDPMQSIYMFRQAEVELFAQTARVGLPTRAGSILLETLRLTANFRSTSAVVEPLNAWFSRIFCPDGRPGGVHFFPSTAQKSGEGANAVNLHAGFCNTIKLTDTSSDDQRKQAQTEENRAARQRETAGAVNTIALYTQRIREARDNNVDFTVAVLGSTKRHLAHIADALRTSSIAFRSVELEALNERQEILDLRSLTRALLHPMDRIAWLSVLRAPWCGLPLRDLHLLCGTDGRSHSSSSVLEEATARMQILDEEARSRLERTLSVMREALRVRYEQSSLASWIERVWNSLGGPACVDSTGYENALVYFRMIEPIALDGIDAVGSEIEAGLARLFAQPDPDSSERRGVQLMTIHKAKGLGFNVVIVPGLERAGKQDTSALICYLERTTETGQEMLVAPIGSKGSDSSKLYKWVQRQVQHRETEERKRLLYVACTRAREELHLFATATVTDGKPKAGNSRSLLATAWPALEEDFAARYEQYKDDSTKRRNNVVPFRGVKPAGTPLPGVIDIAAAASPALILRRLPAGWKPRRQINNVTMTHPFVSTETATADLSERPNASRERRLLGTAVHALFEKAARIQLEADKTEFVPIPADELLRSAVALLRNAGIPRDEVARYAALTVEAVQTAFEDPLGQWILRAHARAQSETTWTGLFHNEMRTLRVDRTFWSGPEPLSTGDEYLWIVDYKTAASSGGAPSIHDRQAFLAEERARYSGQLTSYGQMMQMAHGPNTALRLALYYPLMRELIWWEG